MLRRSLVRAGVLATVASLAVAGLASADAILTDGDGDMVGQQQNVHIGTVVPGAVVTVPVDFELRCSTANHVAAGSGRRGGGVMRTVFRRDMTRV